VIEAAAHSTPAEPQTLITQILRYHLRRVIVAEKVTVNCNLKNTKHPKKFWTNPNPKPERQKQSSQLQENVDRKDEEKVCGKRKKRNQIGIVAPSLASPLITLRTVIACPSRSNPRMSATIHCLRRCRKANGTCTPNKTKKRSNSSKTETHMKTSAVSENKKDENPTVQETK